MHTKTPPVDGAAIVAAAALHLDLQARRTHPVGDFDSVGRWYSGESGLIQCCAGLRPPSRRWPYSQLLHQRTLAHVMAAAGIGRDQAFLVRAAGRVLKSRGYRGGIEGHRLAAEIAELTPETLLAEAQAAPESSEALSGPDLSRARRASYERPRAFSGCQCGWGCEEGACWTQIDSLSSLPSESGSGLTLSSRSDHPLGLLYVLLVMELAPILGDAEVLSRLVLCGLSEVSAEYWLEVCVECELVDATACVVPGVFNRMISINSHGHFEYGEYLGHGQLWPEWTLEGAPEWDVWCLMASARELPLEMETVWLVHLRQVQLAAIDAGESRRWTQMSTLSDTVWDGTSIT